MKTFKKSTEKIELFGASIEVQITIKTEHDPDGWDLLVDSDLGPEREETLEKFEKGEIQVFIVSVEVETIPKLFYGSSAIGGVFIRTNQDIYDSVNEYCLVDEAIDDLKNDAGKYFSFFKKVLFSPPPIEKEEEPCPSCDDKGYLEVTQDDNCEYIQACDNCDYFGLLGNRDERAREAAVKDGYVLNKKGRIE